MRMTGGIRAKGGFAPAWAGALLLLVSAALACGPSSGEMAGAEASVGERAPEFTMELVSGEQVTTAALVSEQQPAHLFYFATW